MLRADLLIARQGLAASRAQAQRLIASGGVQWRDLHGAWQLLAKANLVLPENTPLRLVDDSEARYVSRGGLKLAGALAHCQLDVTGMACLDIGQSTGGFTDCLLQAGASRVVGVDVGHGQLHERLCEDPRVTCIEKCNARALPATLLEHSAGGNGFDLAVLDLSFISQTLVLPAVVPLLKKGGYLLSLVKPQFEAGPQHINRQGLLKGSKVLGVIEEKLRDCCATGGLYVLDYFPSAITGGDGNREFFLYCRVSADQNL
jgi:23S rRNA (cytidine1920-2'-O)/16S rRNA (cytidine1409-2'-O)-methyltransferase